MAHRVSGGKREGREDSPGESKQRDSHTTASLGNLAVSLNLTGFQTQICPYDCKLGQVVLKPWEPRATWSDSEG